MFNEPLAGFVVLPIYAVIVAVPLLAGVKIVSKAGYWGWWVLLAFVPVMNVVMFLVFAFSDWPILRVARNRRSTNQPSTLP